METQEQCDALSLDEHDLVDFKIYPNPAQNYFSITTNQPITKIKVFDLSGKQVKTFGQQKEHYAIKDLAKGLYFLDIKTTYGIYRHRLIVK